METVEWQKELITAGEYIMKQGGELHFRVTKRGRERIPTISIFPDNYIRCKTETLITD